MKKIVALSAIACLATASFAADDTQAQIDALEKKLKKMEKRLGKVNAQSAKDNIKFDIDFRTSYDKIEYETANGNKFSNNALYSNRLWLNMGYAPTDDMIFKGQLAYHKAFGAAPTGGNGFPQRGFGFDTFDWISSETLNDDKLRVREAYWLWTPKVGDVGFTVSVGRRPSTNGFLANLREGDPKDKSPLGHVINMEFDGASAGIKYDGILPGMLFKICLGRGLTNAAAWANQADNATAGNITGGVPGGQPDYTKVDDSMDNVDMAGFIFVPYDDGQYTLKTTWYRGFNVPGMVATSMNAYYTNPLDPASSIVGQAPADSTPMELKNTGDMDGMAISLKVEGIGDEISDFLDETTLFASYAMSVSHPNDDVTRNITMIDMTGTNPNMTQAMTSSMMMGSEDSETGTSIWVGAQMPNLTGGRFGLEYNQGSEYWRPFTYGEDTLIGSKLAVRGSAYEAYWTQPLIGDAFSMQVRYTYLDYDYTGSNGFFGDAGTPYKTNSAVGKQMDTVDNASDLRVYFRYRY